MPTALAVMAALPVSFAAARAERLLRKLRRCAVTKQAECEYALKVDQQHLFAKPFNERRPLHEFSLALALLQQRLPAGDVLDLCCGPGWTSLMLARGVSRAGRRYLGTR